MGFLYNTTRQLGLEVTTLTMRMTGSSTSYIQVSFYLFISVCDLDCTKSYRALFASREELSLSFNSSTVAQSNEGISNAVSLEHNNFCI